MEHIIAAEELEARVQTVVEDVQEQGESVVITKEGRAVALLVSVPEEAELCGGIPVNLLTVDDVVLPVEKWES